jgi:hypothetical protein
MPLDAARTNARIEGDDSDAARIVKLLEDHAEKSSRQAPAPADAPGK